MYYMKLEMGCFTFRPPDHAKVTAEGFTWQMDAEDISRLECDIEEMAVDVETDELKDLQKEHTDTEKECEEVRSAANEADDELCKLERLIQSLPVKKGIDAATVKEIYDGIVEARNLLREVI